MNDQSKNPAQVSLTGEALLHGAAITLDTYFRASHAASVWAQECLRNSAVVLRNVRELIGDGNFRAWVEANTPYSIKDAETILPMADLSIEQGMAVFRGNSDAKPTSGE